MSYRWLLAVLCISACAHQKSPEELRRDAQRAQLRLAAPAELDQEGGDQWRAFKTLRARFYYDPTFAQLEGNVREHLDDRVHRVNQVLEAALHTRLHIADVRALPASPPGQIDLDAFLSKQAEQDEGDDVDVVITLIGALPVATFSFYDLGRAQLLGKHIVIRSMTSAEETRVLDTYDALEPAERSRMYQQRKRHKEATVMLHELGHSLGALHSRDATDIMHARYESSMKAFAPHNLQLMQLALDERLRPAEEQDVQALAKSLKARLLATPAELFVEEERAEHLAAIDAVISPRRASTAQAAKSDAASARDLSGFSEDDKKRIAAVDALQASGDASGAFQALSELADKYPHTHFLQHEACETGMRLRKSFKEIRAYCDRVAAAAIAAPSAR